MYRMLPDEMDMQLNVKKIGHGYPSYRELASSMSAVLGKGSLIESITNKRIVVAEAEKVTAENVCKEYARIETARNPYKNLLDLKVSS